MTVRDLRRGNQTGTPSVPWVRSQPGALEHAHHAGSYLPRRPALRPPGGDPCTSPICGGAGRPQEADDHRGRRPRDRHRARDDRELLAAGVSARAGPALESVYGVGTDLTVTGAQAEPGQGGARFDFGEDGGETTDDGTTQLSQSRLVTEPMRSDPRRRRRSTRWPASTVRTAHPRAPQPHQHHLLGRAAARAPTSSGDDQPRPAPQGRDGRPVGGVGGGAFDVDSFTVLGIDRRPTPSARLRAWRSATAGASRRRRRRGRRGARRDPRRDRRARGRRHRRRRRPGVRGRRHRGVHVGRGRHRLERLHPARRRPGALGRRRRGLDGLRAGASRPTPLGCRRRSRSCPTPPSARSPTSPRPCRGPLSSASSLITSLGTWLSPIVLAVALALAVLFTISGVSAPHARVRHAQGDRLVRPPRRRPGRGRVARAGPPSAVSRASVARPRRHPGDQRHRRRPSPPRPPTGAPADATGEGPGPGPVRRTAAADAATEIVLHAPVTLWVVVAAVGLARPRRAGSRRVRRLAGRPAEPGRGARSVG